MHAPFDIISYFYRPLLIFSGQVHNRQCFPIQLPKKQNWSNCIKFSILIILCFIKVQTTVRYIAGGSNSMYTLRSMQPSMGTLKPTSAVNGHLETNLLKDFQRFEANSTSNLEVYKFRDW